MSEGGELPFPIEVLRAVMRDGRAWARLGVVKARTQGAQRYEIVDGAILVDVLLQTGQPVLARLATAAAGAGVGVWNVPAEGAEVLVLFPEGTIDGGGVIVAVTSTGQLADGVDGSPTIVIAVAAGAKVLIHDGSASAAEALVRKSEFEAHSHPIPPLTATVAGNTGPVSAGMPGPKIADTQAPAGITGTQVLRAK